MMKKSSSHYYVDANLLFGLYLILQCIYEPICATITTEEKGRMGFILSQKAADQVSSFTVREGLKLLRRRPVTVHLSSNRSPLLPSLAQVHIRNIFAYRNISLVFEDANVKIWVRDFGMHSNANISTNLWPMSFGEEEVDMDLKVGQTFLSLGLNEATFENQQLWLKSCRMDRPEMRVSAQNYWLLDKGLGLAAAYAETSLDSLLCPLVASSIDGATAQLSNTVPLTMFIPSEDLPEQLRNVSLRYETRNLRVRNGYIEANIDLKWIGQRRSHFTVRLPKNNDVVENVWREQQKQKATKTNKAIGTGRVEMEVTDESRLTVWLTDGVINELVELMPWDFLWLTDKVPVDSDKIPKASRTFLSTLCTHCYFILKVWNRGPPKLITANGVILLDRYDFVKLRVFNPASNQSSVFVSFLLNLQAEIEPFFDNGTLKAKVNLLNAPVKMDSGAFPSSWSLFVEDLIRGMIMEVMWPKIRNGIERLSMERGLALPDSCGIDPKSVDIHADNGRFGATANLQLSRFDTQKCLADFENALPKNVSKLID